MPQATLDVIPYQHDDEPGFVPFQPYLPLPAHRKHIAVTAANAAALISSCHGLILDMVNRGHRVSTFATQMTNDHMRILSHIGAEPYALPDQMQLFDKYRRLRELTRLFTDIHPDMVLIQSARGGSISVAAARMAKIPHIVTVVSSFGPAFMEAAGRTAWAQRVAMKAVYRTIFRLSDLVVFHSSHDQKYAQTIKLMGQEKPQLTVGGWGEDLVRNFQRPLPQLDRGAIFLMATPLDRLQGILEFCEAAKLVRAKSKRAKFFLASTPGEVATPFPLKELKRYREFVQYVGPHDDPASLIARCHVVVAPSYGNGAPRSLFQALALGRPVLSTDTRSCRDFALHGINGYRVPVRDTKTLAKAMTQILHRPDLIARMAHESRKQALRMYDVNAVNALVMEAVGL